MASSSDTLSYAMELLGTPAPNLTLNGEQWKSLVAVYRGISVFVYRQDLARAFATKLRDRVQERATW